MLIFYYRKEAVIVAASFLFINALNATLLSWFQENNFS